MVCFFLKMLTTLMVILVLAHTAHLKDAVSSNHLDLNRNFMNFDEVIGTVESFSFLPLASAAVNGSEKCLRAARVFLEDYDLGKSWAIKMVDASGKPIAGMLDGTITWLGSYDECIHLKRPENETLNVEGKYCTMYPDADRINPISNFFSSVIEEIRGLKHYNGAIKWRVGLCVPKACSEKDITDLINLSSNQNLTAASLTCSSKKTFHWTGGIITVIILISIFIIMALVGTYLDLQNNGTPGKLEKIFLSFSLPSNCKKILNVDSRSADTLGSLHGMRFISISWIVLGHTYSFEPIVVGIPKLMKETFQNIVFDTVLSGDYAVDTFFFISGLLLCYTFLKNASKRIIRLNQIPMIYFHRWWRLTPVYMMILGISTVFAPLMISGPFIRKEIGNLGDCPKNWWTNILYINNLVDMSSMCVSHSWYLACDMQMFLISPLILFPLVKNPIIGLTINSIFMLISMITPAVLTAIYGFIPIAAVGTKEYFQSVYIRPYCRMVPYCMGIFIGYFLHVKDRKIVINKWLNLLGWIISTVIAIFSILLISIMLKWGNHKALLVSYAALGKLFWSLVVAWICVTTTTGNSTYVDAILSWKFFTLASRLTYCLYLIHPILLYINAGNVDHNLTFSHYEIVKIFLAIMTISLLMSFVLSVMFESPFVNLEKILFNRYKSKNDENVKLRANKGLDNVAYHKDEVEKM